MDNQMIGGAVSTNVEYLYQLARSVQIPLKLQSTTHVLSGEKELPLMESLGLPKSLQLTVVDSVVYHHASVASVLVHCGGNLYVMALADGRPKTVLVFVLNGPAIGVSLANPVIYPVTWSRKTTYERVVKGVKAIYTRNFYGSTGWVQMGEGNAKMVDYLTIRGTGNPSIRVGERDLLNATGVS